MKDMICSMQLIQNMSQNNPSSVNPNPNAGLGLFDVPGTQFIQMQTSSFSIAT